ncbi:MAG: hypothetical protein WBK55_00635 [Alphaproteobacteria bacterium]
MVIAKLTSPKGNVTPIYREIGGFNKLSRAHGVPIVIVHFQALEKSEHNKPFTTTEGAAYQGYICFGGTVGAFISLFREAARDHKFIQFNCDTYPPPAELVNE